MISAQAQTIFFKAGATRVTVPLNYTGTLYVTNLVSIGTNGIVPDVSSNFTVNPINLSATVLPSNPAGLSLAFTDTNQVALPTIAGKLNTSGFKTNVWLQLNLASVPEGLYTISMNATGGATNNALLALQVGYIWNGGTNAITNGPGLFSDGTQWVGGLAPGAGDDALFGDSGGQGTNIVGIGSGVSTNYLTNIVFTANTTIGSMRFYSSNSATIYYSFQINDGVTVALTGSNGFSMIKDSLNNVNAQSAGLVTSFVGQNGTLLVSNENANVFAYVDNGTATTTNDFSGLGTFQTDVGQVALGDYTAWPYYRNLNDQNGYNGQPRSALTSVSLARTNIIKSIVADAFNYTNADNRTYSLSWMKGSELSGSSTSPGFNLGISNIFYLDSALFIGGNSRGNVQFNPIFAASNCIAIFRGTNGGRMSVFTQGDGGGTNTANSNIKGIVTFQLGTLDMLVDRFYLGRDRKLIVGPSGTPNYQANFLMGKGVIDANNAILGFREYNQTNDATFASLGYAQGTVTVVSNGVFKVNQLLTLGYTVATNSNEESTGGNTDLGQVTIMNGGTFIANSIAVGGPTYGFSKNNFIVISNFSTFILSNTLAGPNQSLDSLTFDNNSTNQLTLDGNHVGPYIYATNLVTAGSGNVIRIGSLKNYSFPVQIPLIQYVAGSHTFSVVAPPGFTPNLIDNGPGSTLDVTISTNQPKNLVWRAYVNSTWDNSTANWLDLSTGLHTNFANGDFVAFDDSPTSGQSSLALDPGSSPIVSSGITMTNSILAYSLGGSGIIAGSVALTKTGTSSLTINGNTTIQVLLNQGSLLGSGSIGGVVLATNTVMDYSGIINGSVTSAGTATIDGNGIVNGSLNLLSGGIATNTIGANINGLFSTAPNTLLVNVGNITWNSGAALVSSNSTFNNLGAITGDTITFNPGSTLIDSSGFNGGFIANTMTLSGSVTVSTGGTNVTYPGALFIAGGNGIGSSFVFENSTVAAVPGRLSLFQGSTAVIKVDFSNPQTNTMIFGGHLDLGGSQTKRDFNGCTLVMTNINPTAGAFANGQVFHVFGSTLTGQGVINPTGTSTNSYPILQPAAPGSGLAWDLSHLYLAGNIGIRAVPTSGTNLVSSFTNILANISITGFTTNNSIITTNFATNNIILSTLTWPTNYIGWKLQSQVNPLTVGLFTNWTTLLDSTFTNTISVSNNVSTNQSVFFRMTYP